MTAAELLAQLDAVRPMARGWTARCPSHADRTPSLSVCEGERGLLVKCWAGCTTAEITAALGLSIKDLFYDSDRNPGERRWPRQGPKPWRFEWRKTAAALLGHAEALWLRGTGVLEAARGLNCRGWSDDDLDVALAAVGGAFADLGRAELLEDMAFRLRLRGIAEDEARIGARHAA